MSTSENSRSVSSFDLGSQSDSLTSWTVSEALTGTGSPGLVGQYLLHLVYRADILSKNYRAVLHEPAERKYV